MTFFSTPAKDDYNYCKPFFFNREGGLTWSLKNLYFRQSSPVDFVSLSLLQLKLKYVFFHWFTSIASRKTRAAIESELPYPHYSFCPAANKLLYCCSRTAITVASPLHFKHFQLLYFATGRRTLTRCDRSQLSALC